jgi:hypothetical protein
MEQECWILKNTDGHSILIGNEKVRFKVAKTITELETRERPKERWHAVKVKTSFYRGTK